MRGQYPSVIAEGALADPIFGGNRLENMDLVAVPDANSSLS
jgi:hypothetical protein